MNTLYCRSLILLLLFMPFTSVVLAQNKPNKKGDALVSSYNDKVHQYRDNNIDSALFYADAAIKRATEIKDKEALYDCYLSRSAILDDKASYNSSGEDALSAWKLASDLKDTSRMVNAMIAMGGAYACIEEYKRAFDIHYEALQLIRKSDTIHKIKLLNSLAGNIYLADTDRKRCIRYGQEALALSIKAKRLESEFIAANNLASNYQAEGLCEEALKMADHSFGVAKKLNIRMRTQAAYSRYAELYIYCFKKPQLAISYLDKYIQLSGSRNNHDIYALSLYIDCYLALGDYKRAFEYYEKSSDLNDSINESERRKNLIELESKYKAEKKQEEINLLTVKQAAEVQRKNYAYIGFALVLLLLGVSVYAMQLFRKQNAQKSLLLKEIHHRINNNLQIISSLLYIQVNESDDEKIKKIMTESQVRIQSLSLLHKNLYIGDNPDKIKMDAYISQLISFYVQALQAGNQQVDVELDCENVELSSKKAVSVGLIINELVTNAYKYAFPPDYENGKIKITLNKNSDGTMTLKIIDNGPQSQKDASQGFGSKLIRALTNQLGARMDMQTEGGRAYSFTFKPV